MVGQDNLRSILRQKGVHRETVASVLQRSLQLYLLEKRTDFLIKRRAVPIKTRVQRNSRKHRTCTYMLKISLITEQFSRYYKINRL